MRYNIKRYFATKGDYWLGGLWIKSVLDVYMPDGDLWSNTHTLEFDSWEQLEQYVKDYGITLEGGKE